MAEIARNYNEHKGCEQVLLIFRVKCPYFEILIVLNRPYLAPHTIPCNVFKLSKVPLVN